MKECFVHGIICWLAIGLWCLLLISIRWLCQNILGFEPWSFDRLFMLSIAVTLTHLFGHVRGEFD